MNIKICCIASIEEAHLAIEYGANAIGLVGPMPSGPGIISNQLISDIARTIPQDIESFLLTSETYADAIITHHQTVNTTRIQLVDMPDIEVYRQLRFRIPTIKIVQVIHVIDKQAINLAIKRSKHVDYLLLDSGNPNLAIKELGGTGRVHNWDISKTIVDAVKIPVYLAGGLQQDNVQEAIEKVNPAGVDVCSGVRTNGKLDILKLRAFIEAVQSTPGIL